MGWELFGSIIFGVAIGMLIGQFLISVNNGASLFALMICVIVAEIGARVHLELVAPVILRLMLLRSGEAGKKQGVDFAAGGH